MRGLTGCGGSGVQASRVRGARVALHIALHCCVSCGAHLRGRATHERSRRRPHLRHLSAVSLRVSGRRERLPQRTGDDFLFIRVLEKHLVTRESAFLQAGSGRGGVWRPRRPPALTVTHATDTQPSMDDAHRTACACRNQSAPVMVAAERATGAVQSTRVAAGKDAPRCRALSL